MDMGAFGFGRQAYEVFFSGREGSGQMKQDWSQWKLIQDFFQIEKDGTMPEGTRLLMEAMDLKSYQDGEDLVVVDAPADDGMYIILEGTTKVLNREGSLINELAEGDMVGELALIKDGVRGATVRAAGPVRCAHISRPLFEEIAGKNRKVYGALLDLLYTKTTNMVRERERIQSELAIASRIQTGFLPKSFQEFGRLPCVAVTGRMVPAKGVGGDFYDVFFIDENRLGFLIADVSGKGIGAALFMTMAKIHIRNYMMLNMDLEEMVGRVNKQLNDDNEEELFVTAFICVLDTRENRLDFINAGHNKPFVSRQGGEFQMLSCKANFVLGMMEPVAYEKQSIVLEPGDAIYLYTDGVSEAMNPSEELFGDERIAAALNRDPEQKKNPEELVGRMYQEIEQFAQGAEQSDDITMVYLSRIG